MGGVTRLTISITVIMMEVSPCCLLLSYALLLHHATQVVGFPQHLADRNSLMCLNYFQMTLSRELVDLQRETIGRACKRTKANETLTVNSSLGQS